MQTSHPTPGPNTRGDGGRPGGWVAVAVGALIGLIGSIPFSGWLIEANEAYPDPLVSFNDIIDPGDPVVSASKFESLLVQVGTDQPYSGNGPPGIRLHVDAPGDVIGWTIEGWANATVPPPTPLTACSQDGVHFDRNDWIYQADGGSGNDTGQFSAIPTTVGGRLGPNGDQCHARIQAINTWRIIVCVEGAPVGRYDERGPPRGLYDAPDGRHLDIWDRCFERLQQVPW